MADDEPTGSAESPDPSLETLVHSVSRDDGLWLGVTLIVGGGIIDGDLISGKRWFDELSDWVGKGGGIESQMALDGIFHLEHELYAEEDPGAPYAYAHLRDAKKDSHAGVLRMGLMRLRLSEIGGWGLGRPNY